MQKDSAGNPVQSSKSEEDEYNVDKLIDKMMALKARLMEIGRQSSTPFNIACALHFQVSKNLRS